MKKTIEEFESFEDSGTEFIDTNQYVLVQKPNGTLYKMLSSAIILQSSNGIEYLKNSVEVANGVGTSQEHTFSVGGLFSKNVSAVMASIELVPSAHPNTYLYFYTKADRSDESKHTFRLSQSDKAQHSGHFFWLPVINGSVYIKYTMSRSNNRTSTKLIAGI